MRSKSIAFIFDTGKNGYVPAIFIDFKEILPFWHFFVYFVLGHVRECPGSPWQIVHEHPKFFFIFVDTYLRLHGIIIDVNPPNTLYSFFVTPHKKQKNTFSKEKAAVRIWLLFSCQKSGCANTYQPDFPPYISNPAFFIRTFLLLLFHSYKNADKERRTKVLRPEIHLNITA